jgi:hypothetical protein
MVSALAHVLSSPAYEFLGYLREQPGVRFAHYLQDTIKYLADGYGVSYPTAKRLMKELTTTKVPGCDHPFVGVVRVHGSRRFYPVNQKGECMVPRELTDEGINNEPCRAQDCDPLAGPAHYEAPRGDLNPEKKENVNVASLDSENTEPTAQACLPFAADQLDSEVTSAAAATDARAAEATADPDADLQSMPDDELGRVVAELKASRDQRPAHMSRLWIAQAILRDRKASSNPGAVPSGQLAPSSRSVGCAGANAPEKVLKFETVVGRVVGTTGPQPIKDFACRLGAELDDVGSVGMFHLIGEGMRSGLINPKIVKTAAALAKKSGVDNPGAVFTGRVIDRSPRFARFLKERRMKQRGASR